MNQTQAGRSPVIIITYLLLIAYNLLYWSGKFLHFPEFVYTEVVKHWKLITLFEFLAVASLAVDIIVQFDRFPKREAKFRMTISAILGSLLVLRFILGVMEMYMRGAAG
jgi:hypothetical protein